MSADDHQLSWRRSSRCDSGNCVEVAITDAGVHIRNSGDPEVRLRFSRSEWVEFLSAVKEGELTG